MAETIDYARVADIYDTYVRTTFDTLFFLTEARKTAGEVLELMAGTGRVSVPLLEAGVRLSCVDYSAEMLAVLRRKLQERRLSADVHQVDVRELALSKKFDLIFVPFHSFSELLTTSDQHKALVRIHEHLSENGRFICTLHNPPSRLKSVDGQLRLIHKEPLGNGEGALILWALQNYDPSSRIVSGAQFFEEYDNKGVMRSKRMLEVQFCLPGKNDFETLATSCGFKVEALYGDYSYAEFHEETSPFMIWVLQK